MAPGQTGHPDDAALEQIERAFTYHPPQAEKARVGLSQQERYQAIRHEAKELGTRIVFYTPASRERALALTNLEQAVMWANAAIARNE